MTLSSSLPQAPLQRPRAVPRSAAALLTAGLLCGVLDITAAFLTWGFHNIPPLRILQSIASGLLGPASFRGGWATGALGLALHFLIALTAAAVFLAFSRRLPALLDHPVVAGVCYGMLVYLFMYWVVMPLSRMHRSPVTVSYTLTAMVTHILCVGLPISLVVHRFSRD